MILHRLIQFVCQSRYVFGSLFHAVGDILYFFGWQYLVVVGKELREAADDVKWCTNFVIHILDESHLLSVGLHLQFVGLCQLVVLELQFVIILADGVNTMGQRLLHADEAVGQSAHAVVALASWKWFVKLSLSYALCLFVKQLDRHHGSSDGLDAKHHDEYQTDGDDDPYDTEQLIVACKDVACRADKGYAPACAVQRAIEDESIVVIDYGLNHTAVTGYHTFAQGMYLLFGVRSSIAKDGLTKQLGGVGVGQIGACTTNHDGLRVGVGGERGHHF